MIELTSSKLDTSVYVNADNIILFYEFEGKTYIRFYKGDTVQFNETPEQINELIEAEKRHVIRLMNR